MFDYFVTLRGIDIYCLKDIHKDIVVVHQLPAQRYFGNREKASGDDGAHDLRMIHCGLSLTRPSRWGATAAIFKFCCVISVCFVKNIYSTYLLHMKDFEMM